MESRPVVVGVDGSEQSKLALAWAARYSELADLPLEALAAWETPTNYGWPVYYDDVDFEKQTHERLEQTVRDVLGERTVELRVHRAHPAAALIDASRTASILVVGQHGHGKFRGRLLGSVSQHCVQHAHCPVVVVRGE